MAVTWSDYSIAQPRPASDASIREVERILGVKLPADYIAVACRNQGRAPTPARFRLPDGSQSVFNDLLHFEPAVASGNLLQTWRDCRGSLPEAVVPFASDPGGNLLCFDYRRSPSRPPVVFWAHDDPQAGLQLIAASFTELIALLHAGG